MAVTSRIVPCLWFDDQAESAVALYLSVFRNSKVTGTTYFSDVGHEFHGKTPGSVMTIDFEIDGQPLTALNGGPQFTFTEAISLQVFCDTQQEIDYYWDALGAGGDPKAQQCGWLKDRFGVSWQVVPSVLNDLIADAQSAPAKRVMAAMFKMKKLDLAEMQRAAAG